MTADPSNPSEGIIPKLETVLTENVTRYFAPLKPAEKTLEKVEFFAQKQLNFFLEPMIKQSPELRKKWGTCHPFIARVTAGPDASSFQVRIISRDEGRKF